MELTLTNKLENKIVHIDFEVNASASFRRRIQAEREEGREIWK